MYVVVYMYTTGVNYVCVDITMLLYVYMRLYICMHAFINIYTHCKRTIGLLVDKVGLLLK